MKRERGTEKEIVAKREAWNGLSEEFLKKKRGVWKEKDIGGKGKGP